MSLWKEVKTFKYAQPNPLLRVKVLTSFRLVSLLSSQRHSDDFFLLPLLFPTCRCASGVACRTFFSSFRSSSNSKSPLPEFFFFLLLLLLLLLHRSCLSVFLLQTVCCAQKPTGGLNTISLPQQRLQDRRCAQKQHGRQRSAWRFAVTLERFFFRGEERERGRERGGERGRSVGLQLLLPPPDSSLRIAPFFTHCLLF